MEALSNAIRLRTLRLGSRMINILHREIKLVFVMLGIAAIFRAAISQHTCELHLLSIEEWQDTVVQEIGCGNRRLAIIELGKDDLGIGVDEGLLVDAADALHVADVESVLRAAIARALALEFAVRLLLFFSFFQRYDLRLGQNQPLLRDLGFQGLEPLLHRLEIVTLPDTPDARRRDRKSTLPQLIGDADLAERRLLEGERNYGVFDLLPYTIRYDRLLAGDFLQRQLAAFYGVDGPTSAASKCQGGRWWATKEEDRL